MSVPASATAAPLLDLPRLVMRRGSVVGVLVLLLALVLGLLRMDDDIGDEVDAAMTLASAMARLGRLAQTDDRSALEALRAMQAEHPLRHLSLHVHAQDGSVLLAPPPPPPASRPMRWLLDLHRDWLTLPDPRRVAWQVPRVDGRAWTVALAASHDSERREAMESLIAMLGLLLLCVVALLLAMHWNVRRAFAPLGRLLQAIAGIEGHDPRQVQALPTMPIRELESLAAALRHLGGALEQAEAQQRRLGQQVLSLQEEERGRLARELHDEFGQRLTALRVDAAWLSRQLAGDAKLKQVVDGMAAQCAMVQQDIRSLLTRLQPFGPSTSGADACDALPAGVALLRALVDGWVAGGRGADLVWRFDLAWLAPDREPAPWPGATEAQALCLPQVLWLTIYRISQEALTNIARHAQATEAVLQLRFIGVPRPGAEVRLAWSVQDDGIGIEMPEGVLPRGNGVAGIQQRVWAQGADLRMGPAVTATGSAPARPGWRLEAEFSACWLPSPEAH